MRKICNYCRHRLAQVGSELCAICASEGEAFLAKFQPHGDSIEDHGESWAIGLACVGFLLAGIAALAAIVKSGQAAVWWPM